MRTHRIMTVLLAIVAALLASSAALGDRVHLKDGRVLDGEIVRETEGFLYVRVKIGGIDKDELVLRSSIDRIERDEAEAPKKNARERTGEDDWAARDDKAAPSDGSVRVAFITLEEMVGPYMFAPALKDAVEAISDDDVDIVILRVNSGGGALVEIQPLLDVIEDDIKPNYRVAAWIESAISAAAMTASICEEIYFMSEGNMGAATGFRTTASGAERMEGRELEEVLRMMEGVSERGQKDPLIMRAMEIPIDLSADFAADGSVVWRNDLEGEHIVSTKNGILTFDSVTAMKYKYAQGIADSKAELMRTMGVSDWVEVAPDGDKVMVDHREEYRRAEAEVGKLWTLFVTAANQNGDLAQARRYLGQLKAWSKRNGAIAKYGAGGSPPLSDEVFRNIERQLDREARQQRNRQR